MSSTAIPDFDVDEQLESLLEEDPNQLDEETLSRVQLYKARKLKAKEDAGLSSDRPHWWDVDSAPETLSDYAGGSAARSKSEPQPEPDATAAEHQEIANQEINEPEQDQPEPENHGKESSDPESRSTDTGYALVDYYRSLKQDLSSATKGTPAQETTDDNGRSPATESKESSEETETPGEERVRTGQEAQDGSGSIGDDLEDPLDIAELEQTVRKYHDSILEMKDEIADLRAEKARLEERLRLIEEGDLGA